MAIITNDSMLNTFNKYRYIYIGEKIICFIILNPNLDRF